MIFARKSDFVRGERNSVVIAYGFREFLSGGRQPTVGILINSGLTLTALKID